MNDEYGMDAEYENIRYIRNNIDAFQYDEDNTFSMNEEEFNEDVMENEEFDEDDFDAEFDIEMEEDEIEDQALMTEEDQIDSNIEQINDLLFWFMDNHKTERFQNLMNCEGIQVFIDLFNHEEIESRPLS